MKPLFVLFFSMFVIEETKIHAAGITGQVIDSLQQPLEFASVFLLKEKDSSMVFSTLSDETGHFVFENVSAGNYLLTASMLGYSAPYEKISFQGQPYIQNLELKETAATLQETEVVFKVPLVERVAGKTILNVENSISAQGQSALEVLKQAPGVVVSEGNISLQGKSNVLVMIDDRPTYLNQEQVNAMLQSMPSNQISKIEVITNPSAKYDAAGNGGIINIKLKKKKKAGFNMTIDATYAQGMRPGTIDGINFNFKKNKWNLFGDYHFNLGTDKSRTNIDIDYTKAVDSTAFLKQFTKGWENYFSHPFKLGADYSVSDKTTIGILFNGNYGKNPSEYNTETRELNTENALIKNNFTQHLNNYYQGNIAGNIYTKHTFDSIGKELTVNFDYANYYNRADDQYLIDYFNNENLPNSKSKITDDQQSLYDIYAVKADFTLPLNKIHSIETGAKSTFILTDNEMKLYNYVNDIPQIDSLISNDFNYKENINAIYVSYSASLKKFSFIAGLRFEQTNNSGVSTDIAGRDSVIERHYNNLFPNASVVYKPDEKHSFTLAYNRRIDRPTFNQLNPFLFYLNPYVWHIGNPYLTPQFTHNTSVTYGFSKYMTLTASYSHTNNFISEVINAIEDSKSTYHTSTNLGLVKVWNVNINVPTNITKWWFMNTYAEFNVRKQQDAESAILTNKNTYAVIQSTNQFTLPKNFKLETTLFYQSKLTTGNIIVNPLLNWSMGIQKSFKDNQFSIKANVTDILYTMKVNANIPTSGLDRNTFQRSNDSRALYLTFTYNFDKNNTGSHKGRKTGLDEENRRAAGGS